MMQKGSCFGEQCGMQVMCMCLIGVCGNNRFESHQGRRVEKQPV